MKQVNVLEAKTNFSELIRMLETGEEKRIIIARYGKPVAELKLFDDKDVTKRIGIAKGQKLAPDDINQYDDEVAALFGVKL